jgi:hypothetical protein
LGHWIFSRKREREKRKRKVMRKKMPRTKVIVAIENRLMINRSDGVSFCNVQVILMLLHRKKVVIDVEKGRGW